MSVAYTPDAEQVMGPVMGGAHSGYPPGGEPDHELAHQTTAFLQYLAGYRQASPLTVDAYGRDLARLSRFLHSHRLPTDVRSIDGRVVQAFAVSMSGLAPATICRALNAVSSFFSYALRSGLTTTNPVEGVVKPKTRDVQVTIPKLDDCRGLVEAAGSTRERAMVMLLLTTGLRRAELLDLRLANVAADLSHLTVFGKGGKLRMVPIPDQTRQVLTAYLAERSTPSDLLFTNAAGQRVGNTSFYRLFRRLLRRSGVDPGVTPHSLRHQYATVLLHSGVDVKTCQELLGHADLSTTSRYLHTGDEAKKAAAAALPSFVVDVVGEVS